MKKFLNGLFGTFKMMWDPQKRRKLQESLERMEKEGLDPADGKARRAWVRAHRQELRPLARSESTAAPSARPASKIGRNDPCPCGSGKKYKKCCGFR